MAVNYIKLFDVAYSTSIPESVKEAVFDRVELPITEGLELSSDICECVRFLDNLAYSNMSEDLANSIIDDVFEGCSEEYLEEVYEAYIQAKSIQYIAEDSNRYKSFSQVMQGKMPKTPDKYKEYQQTKDAEQLIKSYGDSMKHRTPKATQSTDSESWDAKTYRKDITTPRAIQDIIDKAEARKKGNFISKAKEGIKSAVGKVKNWWNGRKQKAETIQQQSTSTPQQSTSTPQQSTNTSLSAKQDSKTYSRGRGNDEDYKELRAKLQKNLEIRHAKRNGSKPEDNNPVPTNTGNSKVVKTSTENDGAEDNKKEGNNLAPTNTGNSKVVNTATGSNGTGGNDGDKGSPEGWKEWLEKYKSNQGNQSGSKNGKPANTGNSKVVKTATGNDGTEDNKGEVKSNLKLRPGQREDESLGAFRKRMKAEGKVYNRKTKMYEPAEEGDKQLSLLKGEKENQLKSEENGGSGEGSSKAPVATVEAPVKPKKNKRGTSTSASKGTEEGTSTDTSSETNTPPAPSLTGSSSTVNQVTGDGNSSGNEPNDGSSKKQGKASTPKKQGKASTPKNPDKSVDYEKYNQNLGKNPNEIKIKRLQDQINSKRSFMSASANKPSVRARFPEYEAEIKKWEEEIAELRKKIKS